MSEKKVTKHDLYEKLWASRDFEINHLWQRSIFLATFIVALFTIYFSVLNNFTSSKSVSEDLKIERVKSTESYEGYAIAQDDKSVLVVKDDRDESLIAKPCFKLIALDVICLFGFLFSVLWICMAKGSKYMYERHERGIEAAHGKGSFDKDLKREITSKWNGFYDYVHNKEFSSIVSYFLDGTLQVVGEKDVIISACYDSVVNNAVLNIAKLELLFNLVMGKYYNIAFVLDDDWEKLRDKYIFDINSGKKYVYIDKKKENSVIINEDETLPDSVISAQEIFGNDIVEVK